MSNKPKYWEFSKSMKEAFDWWNWKEKSNVAIEQNLNNLSGEIDKKKREWISFEKDNKFYSFEVYDQWRFKAKVNWVVFDKYFEKEELVNFLRLTKHILKLYYEWWHNDWKKEKFYSKLWFLSVTNQNDLYVDNRIINDTTFLSNEWLSKKFPDLNLSWLNKFMDKYTDFLNEVIEKN